MKPKLKSEETRDGILEAALKVFHDRGLDSTTMRDIVARGYGDRRSLLLM